MLKIIMNYLNSLKLKTNTFIQKEFLNPTDLEKKIYKKCVIGTFCLCFAMFLLLSFTNNSFHAGNYFDNTVYNQELKNLENQVNEIYLLLSGSATLIAVVMIAINLVTIMTSKNQRKLETSVAWIKGIIIAWACIMLAGVFWLLIKELASFHVVTNGLGNRTNSKFEPLFNY